MMKYLTKKTFGERLCAAVATTTLCDIVVDCIIVAEDTYQSIDQTGFVVEAKNVLPFIPGTKYTYRIDIPFGEQRPGNMKHIHIFAKGKDLWAMNADGTAHDGSHNVCIPQDVIHFLQKKGFTLPPNNIIEFMYIPTRSILLESNEYKIDEVGISVLAMRLGEVIRNASSFQLLETNVDVTSVLTNSKVANKYTHVLRLEIPVDYVSYYRDLLQQVLADYPNFNNNLITIFDHNRNVSSHSLYVIWSM